MYRILYSVLAIFFSLSLFAQNTPAEYCGTDYLGEERESFLKAFQSSTEMRGAEGGAVFHMPVKIHLVADNSGNNGYTEKEAYRMLCDLNDQFAPYEMQFFMSGDFNHISNSDYHIHDFNSGYQMMQSHNFTNVINIYFVQDPAGACGYFSHSGGAVAVARSCAGPGNTTVAHELGHFLSLPHTFRGWEGRKANDNPPSTSIQERADGSNCATAGDGFCDTPADYLSFRWNCPYNGPTLLDPIGDTVIPDPTYYMSYSSDACQDKFSNQQKQAMRDYLQFIKPNLISSNPPASVPLGNIDLVAPINGESLTYNNHVKLEWDPVPGATKYHVLVSKYNTMYAPDVSAIITGTNFTVTDTLVPGFTYKWTVKPLNEGNVCAPYSSIATFVSGQVLDIEAPEDFNASIQIYPNPLMKGQRINIAISSETHGEGTLEIYSVTGALLKHEVMNINKGTNTRIMDLDGLMKGVYLLKYRNGQEAFVRKFVITE